MSNLEIIKKIAQIENLDYSVVGNDCFIVKTHGGLRLREIYNPFDDAVNHRLMIKHDVTVEVLPNESTPPYYPTIESRSYGKPQFYDDYNLAVLSIIIKKHTKQPN